MRKNFLLLLLCCLWIFLQPSVSYARDYDAIKQTTKKLVKTKQYKAALDNTNTLLRHVRGKEKRQYQFLKGYILYELGYEKKAIRRFNHALKPGDELYDLQNFFLAKYYTSVKKWYLAKRAFSELDKNNHLHDLLLKSDYLHLRLIKTQQPNHYKRALSDFIKNDHTVSLSASLVPIVSKEIHEHPNNHVFNFSVLNFSKKLFNKRRYKQSLKLLKQITPLLDKDHLSETYFYTAKSYVGLKKYKQAEELFKKAYHQNDQGPYAVSSLYQLSKLARSSKDMEEEKRYLRLLHRHHPHSNNNASGIYSIAIQYEVLGQDKDALKLYKTLLNKYPLSRLYDDALWKVGYLYVKHGEIYNGYKYFDRLSKFGKGDFYLPGLYWQANMARRLGKQNKAKSLYKRIQNQYPKSFYSYRIFDQFGWKSSSKNTLSEQLGEQKLFAKYMVLEQLGLGRMAIEQAEAAYLYPYTSKIDKKRLKRQLSFLYEEAKQYKSAIAKAEKPMDDSYSIDRLYSDELALKSAYPIYYKKKIFGLAKRYDIDPYLLLALIREESRFKRTATSRSGAIGLMQLMPKTARGIAKLNGIKIKSKKQIYEVDKNLLIGSLYVKRMLNRWDGDLILTLASYNGGPTNVSRWLKKFDTSDMDLFVEMIPLTETKNYVKKVLTSYWAYKNLYDS
jgi:soluble lytic murein transglycosylase-like protein